MTASASAGAEGRGHFYDDVVVAPDTGPMNQFGGRLVFASNIACMTYYRATRALPCDQPV